MKQVYTLPTAKPYVVSGEYYRYVSNVKQTAINLNNIVFYDKEGIMESGTLGIRYKVQISQTDLPDKPGLNDIIKIDGREYKIINPQNKRNPLFYPFWQFEVKSVKS